jgi:hypothetical protein
MNIRRFSVNSVASDPVRDTKLAVREAPQAAKH